MINVSLNSIIKSMKNIDLHYRITRDLDKHYVDIIKRGDWTDDGTGRGVQCHLDDVHYYIIFSQISLKPFNKAHAYDAYIDIALKSESKYTDTLFCHRVNLELSGELK